MAPPTSDERPLGFPDGVQLAGDWDSLFTGAALAQFEAALPTYLQHHRWFAGKARTLQSTKLVDVIHVQDAHGSAITRLLLVRADYAEGATETYVLPVVFASVEHAAQIVSKRANSALVAVNRIDTGESAVLCDTTHEPAFWYLLLSAVTSGGTLTGQHGKVTALQTTVLAKLASDMLGDTKIHGGEQSNTSAVLGQRLIMKLFRRLVSGENPDWEIGRFLTEHASLACVPPVAGALEYRDQQGETSSLAVLHGYVANQGDAWVYTLGEIEHYLERIGADLANAPPAELLASGRSLWELAESDVPPLAVQLIGPYLSSAALLGQRTAEMHLALATGTDAGFSPELFTARYQQGLGEAMQAHARQMLRLLERRLPVLPESARELAGQLLSKEALLLSCYGDVAAGSITALRQRCHGDYHLGQVLFTGEDFAIIDFEGEPDRPIHERRLKRSPLCDVAGLIRSFHYASHVSLRSSPLTISLAGMERDNARAWLSVWYAWSAAAFLKTYLTATAQASFLPNGRAELQMLLDAYLLEKAVYELGYELNNRPDWVAIPLEGIVQLLQAK